MIHEYGHYKRLDNHVLIGHLFNLGGYIKATLSFSVDKFKREIKKVRHTSEYKADYYNVKAGLRKYGISFLEKIKKIAGDDDSDSHPRLSSRISKLSDAPSEYDKDFGENVRLIEIETKRVLDEEYSKIFEKYKKEISNISRSYDKNTTSTLLINKEYEFKVKLNEVLPDSDIEKLWLPGAVTGIDLFKKVIDSANLRQIKDTNYYFKSEDVRGRLRNIRDTLIKNYENKMNEVVEKQLKSIKVDKNEVKQLIKLSKPNISIFSQIKNFFLQNKSYFAYGGIAAAVGLLVYLAYKQWFSSDCSKLFGIKRKECEVKVINKALDRLRKEYSKCSKTEDKKTCQQELKTLMNKWKNRKKAVLS